MMKHTWAVIIFALLLSSCLRMDSFLYNPNTDITEYKLDEFEGETEIELDNSFDLPDSTLHLFTLNSDLDGDLAEIYAVYVGDISSISQDTVILYLHGNTGHLDYYWPRIKLLANTGHKNRFGVMAIDYRGYGLSEGTPGEGALYADTDAAMKWLKENGLTADRLITYGFSMGSAPATELTANPRTLQPSKLMLESPFASDDVMIQDASGLSLPGSFVSDLEINNGDEIRKVEEPFFWIHGTDDDFLSIETHGEVVFNNYDGSYSIAHRVQGAVHNNVPFVMGYGVYLDVVLEFLERTP
ncbi:MAG: alpha/beta hydrolase [Salibacteraceae bacterium]